MKHIAAISLYTVMLAMMCICAACSDDDKEGASIIDKQIGKLAGTWKAVSVSMDQTYPEGYEEFELTIVKMDGSKGLNYLIANNAFSSPWISVTTGRFTFDSTEPDKYLIREDGVKITYTVSETSLTMSFMYDEESSGGRISGVTGMWDFTFEK